MQTFLPYKDFKASAKVLDNKRLGKQRVETLQIMRALTTGEGWIHHPATKMWEGYEYALLAYQEAICDEWAIKRGFNDTCLVKTQDLYAASGLGYPELELPKWLGLKKFHTMHRANLIRKDPIHYGRFGWKEEAAEGYWWPVENGFKAPRR